MSLPYSDECPRRRRTHGRLEPATVCPCIHEHGDGTGMEHAEQHDVQLRGHGDEDEQAISRPHSHATKRTGHACHPVVQLARKLAPLGFLPLFDWRTAVISLASMLSALQPALDRSALTRFRVCGVDGMWSEM